MTPTAETWILTRTFFGKINTTIHQKGGFLQGFSSTFLSIFRLSGGQQRKKKFLRMNFSSKKRAQKFYRTVGGPFLTVFFTVWLAHFLAIFGQKRAFFGHFLKILVKKWAFFGHFWSKMGIFGHFWAFLAIFWAFLAKFRPFLAKFWPFLANFC